MTLDRSYKRYLGFLGIDFKKSLLMYSKDTICHSRLLFKMGLFTYIRFCELLQKPAATETSKSAS